MSGVGNPVLTPELTALDEVSFFDRLLSTGVTLILVVGGIVFLFMLLFGGLQWITAGGDTKKVEEARARITQALVGLVLLFSAYAVIALVSSIFGIKILAIDINPLIIQ